MSLKTASVSSGENEYSTSLRWTALLSSQLEADIIGATGIHDGLTAVKLLLAGAKAVEVVSTVYKNGDKIIGEMNNSISAWMDENSFPTTDDFIGKMSSENSGNTAGLERVQYMKKFGDI